MIYRILREFQVLVIRKEYRKIQRLFDRAWLWSKLVEAITSAHGHRKFHKENVAAACDAERDGGSWRRSIREEASSTYRRMGSGGLAGVYLAIEGSDKPRRQCEPSIVGATESGIEGFPRKRRTEKEEREKEREDS